MTCKGIAESGFEELSMSAPAIVEGAARTVSGS
jgi:hypothetical protein